MGMKVQKEIRNKNPALERRSFFFQVRAAEDEQHGTFIEGRPIVFESRTDLGYCDEIIHKGSLDKTDLTDVRFLVNHDLNKIPLARSRRNNENSTMQLKPDDKGMGIRVNLDTENNMDARALYSAVKRGDITGMSFMFGIRGENWENLDTDHPTRHITDISTVIEVSAVTFPAYEDTEINARGREALDNARKAVETARGQSLEKDSLLELWKLKNQNLGGC